MSFFQEIEITYNDLSDVKKVDIDEFIEKCLREDKEFMADLKHDAHLEFEDGEGNALGLSEEEYTKNFIEDTIVEKVGKLSWFSGFVILEEK